MDTIKSGIEILRSRKSLAVVAGMKNRMTTQNRQKSNAIFFLKMNNYLATKLGFNQFAFVVSSIRMVMFNFYYVKHVGF